MTKPFAQVKLGKIIFVLTMGASLLIATTTFAEQTGDISLKGRAISRVEQSQVTLQQTAKMWGLTANEYTQYLQEMANTPSARWWKDIDPPQVLGMNAKTQAERMKYARIDAKLDMQRAGKEIAFQHAYNKAFAELYPNAKLIGQGSSQQSQDASSQSIIQSNDRFYLFTKINDSEGDLLTSKIIRLMKMASQGQSQSQHQSQPKNQSNVSLNIFFVGNTSSSAIQQWAKGNNIPRAMKGGDRVTLNHNEKGNSNMLKEMVKSTKVTLPVLVRVRDGRSQLISLMSS